MEPGLSAPLARPRPAPSSRTGRVLALLAVACLAVAFPAFASAQTASARGSALEGAVEAAAPLDGDVFAETGGRDRVDARLNQLRLALALLALAVWAFRPRGAGGVQGRRILLGVLAAAAFAANYNLFVWTALHRHEFFHYYLGAKYFPELGYFRLYTCSVEALRARGEPVADQVVEMTDLRIKQRRPAAAVMAEATPCRPDFSAARWRSFQDDLGHFLALMGPQGWLNVVRDHGYNPSPVWTVIGRPLAELVPPEPAALWQLARIDLWLLLGALLAVGWAFGFEILCLVAIAWGACGMTRYQWTGDAFLRQPWFATLLVGLALVRRGRAAVGGAMLALSGLLRVFPLVTFASLGLVEARRCVTVRSLRPRPAFVRVAIGAGMAAVVLVAASLAVNGRGAAAWPQFAENMRVQTSFTPRNSLGLDYLLGFTTQAPPPAVLLTARSRSEAIEANKRLALARRWPLRVLGLLVFAVLFWRAARPVARAPDGRLLGLEEWEALAAGLLAVPFLTLPGSYYLGFLAAAGVLAARRPRLGMALLAVTAACAASLVFADGPWPYLWSSAAVIVACLWMLAELRMPAADSRLSAR